MNHFSIMRMPMMRACDGTMLREVFHPRHTGVELPYSVAQAELAPGDASLPHALAASDEVYFFLAGRGIAHVDDEQVAVHKGDIVHVPPGARQWLENVGDERLIFFCMVSPPWRAEDEVTCE